MGFTHASHYAHIRDDYISKFVKYNTIANMGVVYYVAAVACFGSLYGFRHAADGKDIDDMTAGYLMVIAIILYSNMQFASQYRNVATALVVCTIVQNSLTVILSIWCNYDTIGEQLTRRLGDEALFNSVFWLNLMVLVPLMMLPTIVFRCLWDLVCHPEFATA
jgi:hypothetical protein